MGTDERNGDGVDVDEATAETELDPGTRRRRSPVRAVAMRPRRTLVKVHRWMAIGLMAWLVVISLTGAWLVSSDAIDELVPRRSLHLDQRRRRPAGRARGRPGRPSPTTRTIWGVSSCRGTGGASTRSAPRYRSPGHRSRWATPSPPSSTRRSTSIPVPGRSTEPATTKKASRGGSTAATCTSGRTTGSSACSIPRPDGAARTLAGAEPGGVKGVVCDVIPDGEDMTAWLGVGFIVVLLVGFYLWYWPGVRRWANVLRVQRKRGPFAFNMSLHKLIGLVVFVPLLVIAVHGDRVRVPQPEGLVRERHAREARHRAVGPPRRRHGVGEGGRARPDRSRRVRRSARDEFPRPEDRERRAARRQEGRLHGMDHPGLQPVDVRGAVQATSGSPPTSTRARCSTKERPRSATSSTNCGATGASRSTPVTSAAPRPGRCGS